VEIEEFTAAPCSAGAYLRALLGAGKPRHAVSLPPLQAVRRGVLIDAAAVAYFRQQFELSAEGPVPPTFAHVLASPLQLRLLTHPRFPLRVLGTVHLRNPIRQERALRVGERVDLSVALGQLRAVPQGLEHDMITEVHDASGALVWRGISTNLLRHGRPRASGAAPGGTRTPVAGEAAAAAEAAGPPWTREWRIALDSGAGRSYARLSGDWNPIHLYGLTAKLFGFRRAIIHGMWTYARVLAALEPHLPEGALDIDVQFRRPLLLPGSAIIRARLADDGPGWIWSMQDRRGETIHAQGRAG
jgi:acyl dehydratase